MKDNLFSDVVQLIVVVTMVPTAVLFFLVHATLVVEIFEIFYFGKENCPLRHGFS